jgi:hypothetical protein
MPAISFECFSFSSMFSLGLGYYITLFLCLIDNSTVVPIPFLHFKFVHKTSLNQKQRSSFIQGAYVRIIDQSVLSRASWAQYFTRGPQN